MRNFLFFFALLSVFSIISSCEKPPVYPNSPQIELKGVTKFSGGDSIQIVLNFKDGDGDLGLSPEDVDYPYQEFDFVLNKGNYIQYDPSNPDLPPFGCQNYTDHDQIGSPIYVDTIAGADFVLIKRNPNYNNYFIDIYVKQVDGTFQLQDNPQCLPINQRFVRLSSTEGPIKGDLSYKLDLIGFPFFGETVKFKIYIQDRALNKSNVIETPEIFIG